MIKINWVHVSESILEGYEGNRVVARVFDVGTGPWHWQLIEKEGGPLQQMSGEELSLTHAKQMAEDGRIEQVARSGRGLVRWENPVKDSWFAFSGREEIGSLRRHSAPYFTMHCFGNGRAEEIRHAPDGILIIEDNWGKFLERAGLAPMPEFKNPPTVTVVMVPVAGRGIILVRRAHQPGRGQLALPGGFQVENETWQEAAAREVFEETGLTISNLRIIDLVTVHGKRNLAFAECDPVVIQEDHVFVHDHEVEEVIVTNKPVELCFQTHNDQIKAFFERHPELRN